MSDIWRHLSEAAGPGFDTVIVIGAGSGSDLPAIRNLKPRKILLLEAHPAAAADLSLRVRKESGEEARSLAVTDWDACNVTLHLCSNPAFSSVVPPLDLFRYAPNLRTVGQLDVPACSLGALLAELSPDGGRDSLLVLDAPGMGAKLLRSVAPESLHVFTWIVFRGEELQGLFVEDLSLADASGLLQGIGFSEVLADSSCLYPHAALLAKRDDSLVRALRARREAEALSSRVRELEALVESQRQRIDDLETVSLEREGLAAENAALSARISDLGAERDQLSAQGVHCQSVLQSLMQERDDLTSERDALVRLRDEQLSFALARQDAMERAARERDSLRSELAAAEAQRDENMATANELRSQLADLASVLNELSRSESSLRQEFDDRVRELQAGLERLEDERSLVESEIGGLEAFLKNAGRSE
jgi:hypothetical protein